MRLSRSARVPRSGRESRTPREPRVPRAPRSPLPAPGSDLPAPGSRWHMVRQSGVGVVESAGGEPQVFVVVAVLPPSRANGDATVEYGRRGERQPTRINLTAFRNRFIPAA